MTNTKESKAVAFLREPSHCGVELQLIDLQGINRPRVEKGISRWCLPGPKVQRSKVSLE